MTSIPEGELQKPYMRRFGRVHGEKISSFGLSVEIFKPAPIDLNTH